jgi:hypothetical protein
MFYPHPYDQSCVVCGKSPDPGHEHEGRFIAHRRCKLSCHICEEPVPHNGPYHVLDGDYVPLMASGHIAVHHEDCCPDRSLHGGAA